MKIIGVIPARYNSSRLPGKPLVDICGKPMVWWVYQRASLVSRLDELIVATDDERIMNVCKLYGIKSIMTSVNHRNGSERLCEVAQKTDGDVYVTIQGDEPLLEKSVIDKVLDTIFLEPDILCATLKTAYNNPVDVINSTTPKVVTDLKGNVLLFTRSPIPYPKAYINYKLYKPIGVYAFKRDIILKYGSFEMGPLEKAEEIELLRLLENGYKIRISEVESDTIAVDTYKDLERVREYINKNLGENYE